MSAYVELHAHSYFSLLDGASEPSDLARRAAELGMSALALTDHDAVYGAVPFMQAARAAGIRPLFRAELTLEGGHHLTLLVKNPTGWRSLCSLITCARHNGPKKGEAVLPLSELEGRTAGLSGLPGCDRSEIAQAIARGQCAAAEAAARRFLHWFEPGSFWIELQHHLLRADRMRIRDLVALANHLHTGVAYSGREMSPTSYANGLYLCQHSNKSHNN